MRSLKLSIAQKARQLGFSLIGITIPAPPPNLATYENWIREGRHGTMAYLSTESSRQRRANPKLILPECKSILVLGIRYSPSALSGVYRAFPDPARDESNHGKIAAYAKGADYHNILPERLRAIVAFIEEQLGRPVPNRWYTDTGPILERDLAQRAGLGWIGKNACLINPKMGSYFLLAEILLGIELEPDPPFESDHCGSCNRCVLACPTQCILPNRTLDARRCISYLTIELKEDIPIELRPLMQDWIFGCDICQTVCPWNRFASEGDRAFNETDPLPTATESLMFSPQAFNQRFKTSPVKRAKRRGLSRNAAIALGNLGNEKDLPVLEMALNDDESMIRKHAQWAIEQIQKRLR